MRISKHIHPSSITDLSWIGHGALDQHLEPSKLEGKGKQFIITFILGSFPWTDGSIIYSLGQKQLTSFTLTYGTYVWGIYSVKHET